MESIIYHFPVYGNCYGLLFYSFCIITYLQHTSTYNNVCGTVSVQNITLLFLLMVSVTIIFKKSHCKESDTVNLYKSIKKISCILIAVVILCLTASPVYAAATIEAKHTTDIAVSKVDWWDRGVQYGRILVLNNQNEEENNVLLATHCQLNAGLTDQAPGYPIYRSEDGGKTWEIITRVTDTLTGANSEWNPTLFELSKPCGDYPAGTIILAACSVDPEHEKESHIRLYFSLDGGYTFDQGVIVASAGGLDDGVWEPYLVQLDDGSIICFYSDDSDPEHSQKIVYKHSKDAENWGNSVDAVTSENPEDRPGMPVVTQLGDGSYFMVYEMFNNEGNPVCYKRSKDGLSWDNPTVNENEIFSKNGKKALGSAPYCAWTPLGSENGTLIVSGTFMRKGESKTGTDYFISYDNGLTWKTIPHIIPYTSADHVGYSNSFAFSKDGKTMYAINNPRRDDYPEKSKMVIAVAELSETTFTQQNDTVIIIALCLAVTFTGAVIVTVLRINKKKAVK